MINLEKTNIWIRINVNSYSILEGTDDLVNELKKNYPVQFRKDWYPAACEGTEIMFQFFADINLLSFLSNVVFPGVAFDITKIIFKKAWKAIQRFIECNRTIDIQCLEFVFNDITIKIEDIGKNNYLNLVLLFQELYRHIIILESKGIKEISLIRLPVVGEESVGLDVQEEVKSGQKFSDCIWFVQFGLGCENCYYNSNTEDIINDYEQNKN